MPGEPHHQTRPTEDYGTGEITLSFEACEPKSTSRDAAKPLPPPLSLSPLPPPPPPMDEIEYDDFGLPIKKLPKVVYDDESDESDDDDDDGEAHKERPNEPSGKLKENSVVAAPAPAPPLALAASVSATPPPPPTVSPTTEESPAPAPALGVSILVETSDKDTVPEKGGGAPSSTHRASMQSLPDKDQRDNQVKMFSEDPKDPHMPTGFSTVSEWSHQQILPRGGQIEKPDEVHDRKEIDSEGEWQAMPAFATYDMYDDDGRLIARAHQDSDDEADPNKQGAAKGYTRVYDDEDVESVTSMDENTKYLFQENENDEASRNPLAQMQATKELLTEGQRIAYVGVCRLALVDMQRDIQRLQVKGGTAKKNLRIAVEGMRMWSQKMMVRLYTHMELSPPEQIMIEQLAEHGVLPSDLTPALMQNSRVHNPMAFPPTLSNSPRASVYSHTNSPIGSRASIVSATTALPEYEEMDLEHTKSPSDLPPTKTLDIDLRWTVLCDLFLVLIADSVYDARARVLLERVGVMFDVSWLDICKFEKRVTDALEMQESTEQNWTEKEHLDTRRKQARNKRFMILGLATVGGGLVIGLSGGLLAPVIGAGLAAGFTTIGVAGTTGFLAGTGGTALIASSAAVSGSYIGGKAGFNRMKSVKTFEFKPLHNAKRVNLIITVSGWMNGKVDDVRLPFSTVDPIMGDLFSIYWEPEMLQSMGQTIGILATEALTQTLQQVLGSTILVTLMAAIQLPVVLTKLSYLVDNPWSVSLDRAAAAGLILADTLVHRNLGVRPVTLVGYSLGARVIYFCLKELARVGASGLVQNAYMFGSPVVVKSDDYAQAASVVSGRFVNGYATNDWILGYLFRATSGGIGRIAGLAAIDLPGVESVNVTELVNGHMAYRTAMPKLLRKVGWEVTSDEFSEIEDPDPENHQERQRELIDELEEARKELDQGSRKKRWTFFARSKDPPKKKAWETYEAPPVTTNTTNATNAPTAGANGPCADNVLFDVDAIRAEIENSKIEEQMQPREIKGAMPTLYTTTTTTTATTTLRHSKSFNIPPPEYENRGYGSFELQEDYDGRGAGRPGIKAGSYSSPNVWADYDEYDDEEPGEMKMTFA